MYKFFYAICLFVSAAAATGCTISVGQEAGKPQTDFQQKILPILNKYCLDCHAPSDKGGLDFLRAKTRTEAVELESEYLAVARQMLKRTMPPIDYDQPSDEERNLVINWVKEALNVKTLDPKGATQLSNYVVEVFEDSNGNLWMGTVHYGAIRFDGKELTYFDKKDGLPSNTAHSFAEDQQGNIWIGTHGGTCLFDGKGIKPIGANTGLPEGEGFVSIDRTGTLWGQMRNGLYRFNGQTFEKFEIPLRQRTDRSYAIHDGRPVLQLVDSQDNLWFAVDGYGAYKYDGKTFTNYNKENGLCSNNVSSITEDRHGNLWFTCIQSYQPKMTGDGGLSVFDGERFKTFSDVKGLTNNDLYTVYEDSRGNIWIGATGECVYRYDGKVFHRYKTDRMDLTWGMGLQAALEDSQGNLWLGFSGGLFRFDGRAIVNVSKEWLQQSYTQPKAENQHAQAMTKFLLDTDSQDATLPMEVRIALKDLAAGKINQANAKLQPLKKANPTGISTRETTLNILGYQLLGRGKSDLAISVFKLNTLLYPDAFNAFDSLAEAYLHIGDEAKCLENYQRSIELNPDNRDVNVAIRNYFAGKRFEKYLIAPENWWTEVLTVPTGFAPTLSIKGTEHLRMPKSAYDPESDWFCSYLFAIELEEPADITQEFVSEQLLIYFRGLVDAFQEGDEKEHDVSKFKIRPVSQPLSNEFGYTLSWREPFVAFTQQDIHIRVKHVKGQSEHGVIFICGSPQTFESDVWKELIRIRSEFESRYK